VPAATHSLTLRCKGVHSPARGHASTSGPAFPLVVSSRPPPLTGKKILPATQGARRKGDLFPCVSMSGRSEVLSGGKAKMEPTGPASAAGYTRQGEGMASWARRAPLGGVLLGGVAGMALDRWWPWGLWAYLAAGSVQMALWYATWRRGRWRVAGWMLLGSLLFLGAAWHHDRWHLFARSHLVHYASEIPRPVRLEGVAETSAQWIPAPPADPLSSLPTTDRTRIELRAERMQHAGQWVAVEGRVLMVCRGNLAWVRAGDRLSLVGRLGRLPRPSNPGQLDAFDAGRGERLLCFVAVGDPGAVQSSGKVPGAEFRYGLARLRGRWDRLLISRLPQQGSLAAAVLLGSREHLTGEQLDAFFHTGTMHLLAISGLHIGILAWGLWGAARLQLLNRQLAVWLILIGSLVYALLTGSRAPIVRASTVLQILCLAWLVRRPFASANALAAAALVVLVYRPADLFRTGAQLSFLAVAALMGANAAWRWSAPSDPLDRLVWRSRGWSVRAGCLLAGTMGRIFFASTAVWLITLPLVMARFHVVAFTAPLLSAVLALPLAIALFSGLGVLIFSPWLPWAASLLAAVCDACLGAMTWAARRADQLPGSCVWVVGPGEPAVAVGYILLAGAYLLNGRRRLAILLVGLAVPIGATLLHSRQGPRPGLECWILSVGHGNCVVVRLPSGEALLMDAGRMGDASWGAQQVSRFLWSQGISRLDRIFVSHADADHYNLIPRLTQRFGGREILVPQPFFEDVASGMGLGVLKSALEERRIPVVHLAAGDCVVLGKDVLCQVLHPPAGPRRASDNSSSLVLVVEYGGQRILLPGDVEPPGLDELLALPEIECVAAVTPHHGNLADRGAEFDRWCQPAWLITSGSWQDWVRHGPHVPRREGLVHLHTARHGAVCVVISDGRCRVTCYREPDD
jgi:competence protein ComEC